MNKFQGTMQPFPGLERWSRQVQLPRSGITLYLYDTGEANKTSIVLLHGLGDEADTWRRVLPLLNQNYRVIAPDLPGFGRSQKPDAKYTIPFFVEAVLELLDVLSISQAVVVGHSMGAVIAHTCALEHPERMERLVLIDGGLVSQQQRVDLGLLLFLAPGLGEWMYNRLRKDPQAAYRTLEPYYNRLDNLPQADKDFLFQRVNERVWSNGQRRAFFSALRGLAGWVPGQQKTLASRFSGWKIPTVVLWGENDRINAVENARALVRMLPSARLVIVPEAGHNLQQEKPEAVAAAVQQMTQR
jgi:pimeloyl-ACP methyl ester carboxylesterase